MLSRKFSQIVTYATTNVCKEHSVIFGLGALDQSLSNGEEVSIHPAESTLAISTHVVIELRPVRRVGLQIRKEVELGVEGVLVRAVIRRARLLIASLSREEIEL